MTARRELYVYYRVAPAHWRAVADAAAGWQRELCGARPGLIARLLRRPDERDGVVTLMEIYAFERDSGAIDDALQVTVERGAPASRSWLIGERHVEPFDALD
jgi:hypothetical protein